MKFFAKTIKGVACILGLVSIIGQSTPTELYQGLSLEKLEALEFDRPRDPHLKEALLKQYWCHGARGLAISTSYWIQRYGPNDMQTKWAQLEKSMIRPQSPIPQELSDCAQHHSN